MFIPYNVDVPMERWPIANWVLIGATVLVSIAVWVSEVNKARDAERKRDLELQRKLDSKKAPRKVDSKPQIDNETTEDDEDLPSSWSEDKIEYPPLFLQRSAFRLWQLIGYTMVHGDIVHLIGNMMFLFVFGNAVNAKLGHFPFLAAYFMLGAVAGLAWLGFGFGPALVGASGAIMGITGVFFVLFPNNMVYVWSRFGTLEIASYWLVLFYMAGDLWGAVVSPGGGVAYVCHLGGELTGTTLMLSLLFFGLYRPTSSERNLVQCLGLEHLIRDRRKKKKKKKRKKAEEAAERSPESPAEESAEEAKDAPTKQKPTRNVTAESAVSRLRFTCSKCRMRLSADRAKAGQSMECPKCNATLRLPAARKRSE